MIDHEEMKELMMEFLDDGGSHEDLLELAREVVDMREADDMEDDEPEGYAV